MSLRVLEIIPTLVRGGAEKQFSLLATGLSRDNFETHVATLTTDGPYRDVLEREGIPVHAIEKRWKIDPTALARTKRLIQKLQPDIVHTWLFAANCYGRHAAISAGTRTIIGGERCVDLWKRWHEFALDRYYAKRSTRIVANSSGVRDFYARHGIPAEKFEVIPNGIGPFHSTGSVDREQLLRGHEVSPTAKLILAVGRLWPQKRYKDLIWAAELLKAARDDVDLLIVGDGPQRERLQQFTEQARVHDRVHFLGPRDDVPQLLELADFFWLGSGYEGQSNALMEAMSAGLPSIVSDISGNRELVMPGETGFLVKVGDSAGFARQTNLLLDNEELAKNIGENAQQHMGTQFTIEQMVQRHAEFYTSLHGD